MHSVESKVLSPAQQALINSIAQQTIQYSLGTPPTENGKATNIVFQGDAVWEISKNKIGTFTAKKGTCKLPGLPISMQPSFQLGLPKIPIKIFAQIIHFFKDVCKADGSEAMAWIYFDHEKNRYFSLVPEQSVSPGHVTYEIGEKRLAALNPARYTLVTDIHSHNTMTAFFSGVDDNDDIMHRIHIVAGTLNTNPACNIRAGGQKKWVPSINMIDICEGTWDDIVNLSKTVAYPKIWHKNIACKVTRVYSYPHQGSFRWDEDEWGWLRGWEDSWKKTSPAGVTGKSYTNDYRWDNAQQRYIYDPLPKNPISYPPPIPKRDRQILELVKILSESDDKRTSLVPTKGIIKAAKRLVDEIDIANLAAFKLAVDAKIKLLYKDMDFEETVAPAVTESNTAEDLQETLASILTAKPEDGLEYSKLVDAIDKFLCTIEQDAYDVLAHAVLENQGVDPDMVYSLADLVDAKAEDEKRVKAAEDFVSLLSPTAERMLSEKMREICVHTFIKNENDAEQILQGFTGSERDLVKKVLAKDTK